MTLWDWITSTTDGDALFTTLGLGVLAVLFATDRILTKGAHERRTADLQAHHARELKEKDARIAEAKESREGWKAVALKERERADKATEPAVHAAEALGNVAHVLESLDAAIGNGSRSHD